jgi:AraC-like DNA-binding protein
VFARRGEMILYSQLSFKYTPYNSAQHISSPAKETTGNKRKSVIERQALSFQELDTKINSNLLAVYYNNNMKLNLLNFRGHLTAEERIKRYPQDHIYRSDLAREAGCSPKQLMSVIGSQELEAFLKQLKPKNFQPGKNLENVNKGIFKANLHMHTVNSDGHMTIESLLNQAADYANRIKNPPVLVAITNHDILDDAQKAIEIIGRDPEKYKNIRVVPGVELSCKYINPDQFNKPVQMELLGYCINPYDKDLNLMLADFRADNHRYIDDILKKAQKQGLETSLKEAKKFHNLLNIGGSPGLMGLLKDYLHIKCSEQGLDKHIVKTIIKDHILEQGIFPITPAVPEMSELASRIKPGIIGMSHPGRTELHGLKEGISGPDAIKTMMLKFKACGGQAVETNYLYPDHYHNPGFDDWLNTIHRIIHDCEFLNSGGIDNHGPLIFVR